MYKYKDYCEIIKNIEESQKILYDMKSAITEDYSIDHYSDYNDVKCFHLYQSFSLARGFNEPPLETKCHKLWENNVCMSLDCPCHLDLMRYNEAVKHNKECVDKLNEMPKVSRVLFRVIKKLQRSK